MRISDWSSDVCSSDLSSLRPHKWVLSEKNSAVLLLNGCLALTASLFVLYARRIFPAGRRFGVSNSGELTVSQRIPSFGIEKQGFTSGAAIHWTLATAPLVELAVKRGEGILAKEGPMVVETGTRTEELRVWKDGVSNGRSR